MKFHGKQPANCFGSKIEIKKFLIPLNLPYCGVWLLDTHTLAKHGLVVT